MKSKPPSKKSRVDPPPPSISLEGIAPNNRGSGAASPSGSTSSTVSSLLSIPPTMTTNSSIPKASSAAVTASSDLFAVAAKVPQQPTGNAKVTATPSGSGVGSFPPRPPSSSPSYPTYQHPDIAEFSRMSMLISMGKGNTGTDGAAAEGGLGGLSMEDIEALQGELETIWSMLAVRMRSLKVEQGSLQNTSSSGSAAAVLGDHYDLHHQEKINAVASLIDAGHGTRTSVSAAAKLVMGSQISGGGSSSGGGSGGGGGSGSGATTGTSKKTSTGSASRLDKLPKKKLKGEAGGMSKKGGEKPARATQNRSHSVSSDFGALDGFLKHEAPSEFWEYADNYCRDVSPSNVAELAKVIEDHQALPDAIFDIPLLGKHFRHGDDLSKHTQRETRSSKAVDSCGPLTQRLVSALVDERIAMHNSQRSNGLLGSPREEGAAVPSPNPDQGFIHHRAGLIKALGLDGGPNRPPMESQLRECLLDRGLLRPEDANDAAIFNSDDEILAEIKRTQNTLRKLHHYNSEKLKELHVKAEKELDRSTFKRELEKADKEVLEAYKTIASLKLKKKPVTKKEKDVATKAIENRERILQKINPSKSEPISTNIALKIEV